MKPVLKIISYAIIALYSLGLKAQNKKANKPYVHPHKIHKHKTFYKNGKVSAIGKSIGCGSRIGNWKYYYRNGQLYTNINYGEREHIIGDYAIYDKQGKLLFKNNYDSKELRQYKNFSKNGKLIAEGYYKNHERVGVWYWYFENGNKKSVETYTDNHYHIKSESYFEDGRLKSLINYNLKGERDGAILHYDYNGVSHQKGNFKAGKKEGKWIFYYDKSYWNVPYAKALNKSKANWNEANWSEVYFVDGVAEGVKKYYQNNKLQRQENYLHAKKEGKFIEINYTEQGTPYISESGYYSNDLETGTWKYYQNDEERIWLSKVENYKLGKLDGLYISYYKNGIIDTKGQYSDGEKKGQWKSYHNSGALYDIGNYKAGFQEGEWRYYGGSSNLLVMILNLFIDTSKNDDTENPDELSEKGTYKKGEKVGAWKYYKDGKLIKTANFD